jgi:2-keto-4-pentenoate hydratase/2-oxohepta-3-ene-1,7-dioic acid hydratase in catechol pathway
VKELGNDIPEDMVVFIKPNSAITDTLSADLGEPLHYEGELAFLVRSGALAAVGFGLDLTKRALQSKLKTAGLPWERAKAFDGAALFSEFVALPGTPDKLSLRLEVDDQLRQEGGVELMIYKPDSILLELQKFITLEDNDIIMTGTPAGVGVIRRGEHFHGSVMIGNTVLVSGDWVAG